MTILGGLLQLRQTRSHKHKVLLWPKRVFLVSWCSLPKDITSGVLFLQIHLFYVFCTFVTSTDSTWHKYKRNPEQRCAMPRLHCDGIKPLKLAKAFKRNSPWTVWTLDSVDSGKCGHWTVRTVDTHHLFSLQAAGRGLHWWQAFLPVVQGSSRLVT